MTGGIPTCLNDSKTDNPSKKCLFLINCILIVQFNLGLYLATSGLAHIQINNLARYGSYA